MNTNEVEVILNNKNIYYEKEFHDEQPLKVTFS